MPVAELPGVYMWYDERGQGDPCVLLHPGGAGIDQLHGVSPVLRDSVGEVTLVGFVMGHAARSRRARWETRVVPSGVPFSQASARMRLRAVAFKTLARRVLPRPW